MDESSYQDLQIKAAICPGQSSWPAPEHTRWQRIHDVANFAQLAVAKANEEMGSFTSTETCLSQSAPCSKLFTPRACPAT
jgi:hypothetical protein